MENIKAGGAANNIGAGSQLIPLSFACAKGRFSNDVALM